MELAFVELVVGRAESAERRLQEALQFFTQIANVWYMNIAQGVLCEAVYAQDRPREFLVVPMRSGPRLSCPTVTT